MTKEEATDRVLQDWKDQCRKLQQAGYSEDEMPPSPPRGDRVLLTHQYMADPEDGRDFLNDLVLGACSGSVKKLADTRGQLKKSVFGEREERFEKLRWQARKTWAFNYEAAEDMARSRLLDDVSLYEWTGVSRAFPSDNRMSEEEQESDKVGPAPSLKTLWQVAAAIGLHPVLFLTDDSLREAVRHLAESNQDQEVVDQATDALSRAQKTWERFEQAEHNDQKLDHREHWLDIIEDFAEDIGCGSPGGILGARLGIEAEDPSTLVAMTRFGHLLGEVPCEGLASVDVFSTPDRQGPFSHQED